MRRARTSVRASFESEFWEERKNEETGSTVSEVEGKYEKKEGTDIRGIYYCNIKIKECDTTNKQIG